MRNNVWRWTAEDKDGNKQNFQSRGPESRAGMEAAALQILGAMTRKALRSGAEDPQLKIVSIEPAGYVGEDEAPVSQWQPPGASPVDLARYAKPAE